MGALCTRHSLRPLFSRGRDDWQGSGKSCRENAKSRSDRCCGRLHAGKIEAVADVEFTVTERITYWWQRESS
jgi:hypothetical protein